MTALHLLGYITIALLLQIAAGMGVAYFRAPDKTQAPALVAKLASGVETLDSTMHAWTGWREFQVTRRVDEDPLKSQCSFYLAPADGLSLPDFKPGQFLTFDLKLIGTQSEMTSVVRCYSLSDQPNPDHYRVTIKRALPPASQPGLPAGMSSSYFHDHVNVGKTLRVKAPAGRFYIDEDASVPAVLIGGGIGITPMMSMLSWCLSHQPMRQVHVFAGARCADEQAFLQDLVALARAHPQLHLHLVFSNPGIAEEHSDDKDLEGWRSHQHAGRVDIDLVKRVLPHGRHQFYVCGPPPMMEALVPALVTWGVPKADIHFEAFGPATVRLEPDSPKHRVAAADALTIQFNGAGRTLAWSGQDDNLLDFAERQGIPMESGCRSGSCGSCQTRLLAGTVHYANPPDFDIASGHCLPCVATPLSNLVVAA